VTAYSRRGFTGLILALFFGPRRGNSSSSDSVLKRYRADAVILLLGIPVYKRAGVGSITPAYSSSRLSLGDVPTVPTRANHALPCQVLCYAPLVQSPVNPIIAV
jgi:hypothetical protein